MRRISIPKFGLYGAVERARRGRADARLAAASRQWRATCTDGRRVPNDDTEPRRIFELCPVCQSGPMRSVYHYRGMTICVCQRCQTAVSVPDEAWNLSRDDPLA
jgi:hypothetical protein